MVVWRNVEAQRVSKPGKGGAKYLVDGREVGPEQLALQYYRGLGYQGLKSEDHYWFTLLALLFWDIIFAKVEGSVVISTKWGPVEVDPSDDRFDELFEETIRANGMPADLFTPRFYERRERLFGNRMRELLHIGLERPLRESYERNFGKHCRLIEDWRRYSIEDLLVVTQRVETQKVLAILGNLLRDIAGNRAGLPDLVVFNERELFLVEVKSEGDRVTWKQGQWHDFLAKAGLKVELFFINHSASSIERATQRATPERAQVTVTIGPSSSANREEAIRFLKEQDSYFTDGADLHGARFTLDENGVKKIFTICKLTRGWKNLQIMVNDTSVPRGELLDSLRCFHEKTSMAAGPEHCTGQLGGGAASRFGCKLFYFPQLEEERWDDFGYLESTTGEWVFDREAIAARAKERAKWMRFCPLFDVRKVESAVGRLPARVNPQKDLGWGFLDSRGTLWLWEGDFWVSEWGDTHFPGLSAMAGVQRVGTRERREVLSRKARKRAMPVSLAAESGVVSRRSSPCFIATAIYSQGEATKLAVLRTFRERCLLRRRMGRVFLRFYSVAGPKAARIVASNSVLKACATRLLDTFVHRLQSKLLAVEPAGRGPR